MASGIARVDHPAITTVVWRSAAAPARTSVQRCGPSEAVRLGAPYPFFAAGLAVMSARGWIVLMRSRSRPDLPMCVHFAERLVVLLGAAGSGSLWPGGEG